MANVEDFAPPLGRYLNAEDRALLAGVPVKITSVDYEAGAKFGPRYLVGLAIVATDEAVLLPLGALTEREGKKVVNEGRKFQMEGLATALSEGDTIDPAILSKGPGDMDPWLFRSATAAELVTPRGVTFPEREHAEDAEEYEAPKLAKRAAGAHR
jgi:hypothetical protein